MTRPAPRVALPTASVVIAARARPRALAACLRAVQAQSHAPLRVAVVECGAPDPGIAAVVAEAGAAYLHEPEGGESRARNLGARSVPGEVVAFTDDDALPEPGWLAALAAEFRRPEVAAAAGRVVPPSGAYEEEARRLAAGLGLAASGGERPLRVCAGDPHWFEIANFGGIGIGPNMAFRRSVFDEWEGFDTRLGTGTPLRGGAEPYAFFTLLKRGHAVAYTPDARVAHPHPLPALEALRERQRHAFAAATGYVAFLTVAEPAHRRDALRYLAEGMAGRRRVWRDAPAAPAPAPPPLHVRLREYLRGVAIGIRLGSASPEGTTAS